MQEKRQVTKESEKGLKVAQREFLKTYGEWLMKIPEVESKINQHHEGDVGVFIAERDDHGFYGDQEPDYLERSFWKENEDLYKRLSEAREQSGAKPLPDYEDTIGSS